MRELQRQFIADVLTAAPVEARYVRAGRLTPAECIAIYRTNVFANLIGALGDVYPVVKAIVGEGFLAIARAYVLQHPSRTGDLNDFGAAFDDFLANYTPAAELPYLAGVARLEWAWHCAFHSADAAPMPLQRLAEVPPEQIESIRFRMHESVALIPSEFPLFDIWRVNQADYFGEMAIDWEQPPGHTLVYRQGFAVALRALSAAEAAFVQVLLSRGTFAEAHATAVSGEPTFELQGFLLSLVQSEVITVLEISNV